MKCSICKKDRFIALCLCGYCKECIDLYTHEGCHNMNKNNEKKD